MAHYINLTTGRFPMAISDIKAENPNTSYSANVAVFDGYQVVPDPVDPVHDRETQRVVSVPPTPITLAWTYVVEQRSAQEIANIAAEATALASTEYQRLRAAAYPSVVDQLDLLFHGGVEGWKAAIQAVKTMYPK